MQDNRTYEVQVLRTAYGSCKIIVKAGSVFGAIAEAINQAGKYEFKEYNANYVAEGVKKLSRTEQGGKDKLGKRETGRSR